MIQTADMEWTEDQRSPANASSWPIILELQPASTVRGCGTDMPIDSYVCAIPTFLAAAQCWRCSVLVLYGSCTHAYLIEFEGVKTGPAKTGQAAPSLTMVHY